MNCCVYNCTSLYVRVRCCSDEDAARVHCLCEWTEACGRRVHCQHNTPQARHGIQLALASFPLSHFISFKWYTTLCTERVNSIGQHNSMSCYMSQTRAPRNWRRATAMTSTTSTTRSRHCQRTATIDSDSLRVYLISNRIKRKSHSDPMTLSNIRLAFAHRIGRVFDVRWLVYT